MRVSSVILVFGVLFGSILVLLAFPPYFPTEFGIFLSILVIAFGLKIIDLI